MEGGVPKIFPLRQDSENFVLPAGGHFEIFTSASEDPPLGRKFCHFPYIHQSVSSIQLQRLGYKTYPFNILMGRPYLTPPFWSHAFNLRLNGASNLFSTYGVKMRK